MNNKNLIIIIIIIIFLSLCGFYLYKKNQKIKKDIETRELTPTETTDDFQVEKEEEEKTEKNSEKRVLMFGRSVIAKWIYHWGSDNLSPVKKQNYILEYKELSNPPAIVDSFENHINNLSDKENSIIFFKLCFDDFEGGSKSTAKKNFERNKKYIEKVYALTNLKDLKLIIGNALPKVPSSTDDYLKWNHKEYNKWLLRFQKEHPRDIFILNMYGVLVDSSGYLRAKYTNDIYDSHPNDEAYSALDSELFKLLKKNF